MKDFLKKILEWLSSLFNEKNEIAISVGNPGHEETPSFSGAIVEPEQEEILVNQNVKILIDNGHGNDTIGKKSPYSMNGVEPEIKFEEWDWNRQISHMVVNKLKNLGYDAHFLVTEINDISLKERVKRVNAICDEVGKENVILISIHANASGDGSEWKKAHGWTAYTTIGKTNSDALAEYFYDEAEAIYDKKDIRVDMTDDDRDFEEDFYIIKKTKCTAILTENFFYDNINDAKYITSEKGKEDIAQLHTKAISKYIDENFEK